MRSLKLLALCAGALLGSALWTGCLMPEEQRPTTPNPTGGLRELPTDSQVQVRGITKYYKDYRSAYSPTYDTPYLDGPEIQWLIDNDLAVDLEFVSDFYDQRPGLMDTLKGLLPHGFGYFGHGHTHIDHDALTYEEAYASFKKNYDKMREAGLKPVSYAYPGGAGFQEETHRALQDAGFLSGRLAWHWSDPTRPVHALPYFESEPPNWYMLPALYMQDIGFEGCEPCVNNPEEFAFFLDASVDQRGWLIAVYHAIGWDGVRHPEGWGYYNLENFYKEMLLAKSFRDQGLLWIASMDAVTLYTMERNATSWHLKRTGPYSMDFYFVNDLDKSVFNHPLTVRLFMPHAVGKRLRITAPEPKKVVVDTILKSDYLLVDLVPSLRPFKIEIR